MNLFYFPGLRDEFCTLPEEESVHATRVLRLKENDPLTVTDGMGNLYDALVVEAHPRECRIRVIRTHHEYGKRPTRLHIAIAPPKNSDRLEWFLEKVTEIGIDEITPLLCDHSERTHLRMPRLEKILVSAMKQSLKAYLPKLNEAAEFSRLVSSSAESQRFIAWCEAEPGKLLRDLCKPGPDTLVLVGPEGDFSPAEIALADTAGFIPASLGPSRLRTETAGIVSCVVVNTLNGM